MNAGFSSLKTLKGHLLARTQRAELTFDAEILALGLGIAAAMGKYCDREFDRVVGATWQTFGGDRMTFILPRYPIESVTAIDLKTKHADPWESQDVADLIQQVIPGSGVVMLESAIGWRGSTLRFTYTGGLWWDTTEDDTGTLPTGATALPQDLRAAWLLQCQEIWSRRDNLGLGLTARPTDRAKLTELDLIPEVIGMLRPHMRHAS